jgi:hypothetical protein
MAQTSIVPLVSHYTRTDLLQAVAEAALTSLGHALHI